MEDFMLNVTPGTSAGLKGWQVMNGASISVILETLPVSPALPNALGLTVPSGKTGGVGFANTGYYGIKVTAGTTYTASFYYRFPSASSFNGNAVLSLQTTGGQVLGSTTAALAGNQTSWKQVTVAIQATTTPCSIANLFAITLDGAAASGQSVNFAMLSLFPPTFKNRPNGMRVDIANVVQSMGPSFWRFPGGNNLEGEATATRWQWNATVGPLINRPGRKGDWGYVNTDGFGLYEHLLWCEDAGMEPLMAVWAGYSLGGTSVQQSALGPYIQQAVDQINFVIGDPATSSAAALRASLGHPAPFKLEYVEVGNEDFFASSSYTYRWTTVVNTLKVQFPNIHFIATTDVSSPTLTPKPTEYDVHVYQTPNWFAQNSFYYDDFARDGTKYFEGEYAAISTNSSDLFGTPGTGRLVYPTMQSSAGEAAFMTGLERNGDIVFAAAYAPLLNHVSGSQWTPNLVSFDSGAVYPSTSFYVQQLFSKNRGDQYLPSTLPARSGTLFWSVVRKTSTNEVIIKISNTVGTAAPMTFVLPYTTVASSGSLQILQGAQTASNTPSNPKAVVPTTGTVTTGTTFNYTAPGFSVSAITIPAV